VPFARCGDGIARHASKTDRAAGPFHCLGCDEPLTFRISLLGRPHFGHKPGSTCSGETALHRYAKELLRHRKQLTVLKLEITKGGFVARLRETELMSFDDVYIEQDYSSFRPDAVVTKGEHSLAIEFRVTHAVDAVKAAKILERDLSTLEIDLAKLRTAQLDGDQLDRAILHEAPRHWIHHKKLAQGWEALDQAIKQRDDARKAEIMDRVANRPKAKIDRAWRVALMARLSDAGLRRAVGRKVALDHWFTLPTELWQAVLLDHYVIGPARRYGPGSDIKIRPESWNSGFSKALADYIRRDIGHLQERKVQASGLDFKTVVGDPEKPVFDYFRRLAGEGSVLRWDSYQRCFIVAPPLHERLQRIEDVRRDATRALGAAKVQGADHILKNWMAAPFENGPSPRQLAEAGGPSFTAFAKRIATVAAMASYSPRPTDDLCGLPVEGLRAKLLDDIAEATRKVAEEEAERIEARRAEIRQQAKHGLADEADAWLQMTNKEGLTWEVFAVGDAASLELARRALYKAANTREHRILTAKDRDEREGKLRAAAHKAFPDTRRADLFLRSGNPKLGGKRPLDCCGDPAMFRSALAQLPRR
jgi:hypothetical protein